MKIENTLRRLLFISFCSVSIGLTNVGCSNDVNAELPMEEVVETPEIRPEDRLPQISVNTNGNTIVDEPKIDATMTVTTWNGIDYDGNIAIEIRGNSSQMFPKKSYGFETRDASNEDLDVSLLGMPEESDWILYAPYSDKALFRNFLIYDLSRDINRYASRTRFVELTLNGIYKGVYVFMEKLKRDAGRIDINKLKEDENMGEDLTGGYILKIDKADGANFGMDYTEANSFASAYAPRHAAMGQTIRFLYEDPKEDEITIAQKSYISQYMDDFENALDADSFTDPELGYAKYIDVPSFIDFFLLNEISNNVDGYRLSTFLQKDKNQKLQMGPIWDFNLAFGNADYCSGGDSNVWAYKFNERCDGDFWQVPFWWERLLQDPEFVAQLKERWIALRADVFSEASLMAKIETYKNTLAKSGAIEKNFVAWPVLGTYVWPNYYVGNTYGEELGYLENWVNDRVVWLDGAIGAL
jgi:hypothetical protein